MHLDEQIKRQKETHKAISSNLTYHHYNYKQQNINSPIRHDSNERKRDTSRSR